MKHKPSDQQVQIKDVKELTNGRRDRRDSNQSDSSSGFKPLQENRISDLEDCRSEVMSERSYLSDGPRSTTRSFTKNDKVNKYQPSGVQREINNNKKLTNANRMYSSHGDIYTSQRPQCLFDVSIEEENSAIKSDQLYGEPVIGPHSDLKVKEDDLDPVSRSYSLGDLSSGLTFSIVGQRKSESIQHIPGNGIPNSYNRHLQVANQSATLPKDINRNSKADYRMQQIAEVTSTDKISENNMKNQPVPESAKLQKGHKSVSMYDVNNAPPKPRRSLPVVPKEDVKEKQKRYTDMMKMRMSSNSNSSNSEGSSSRQSVFTPSKSPKSNITPPSDREVSDLLQSAQLATSTPCLPQSYHGDQDTNVQYRHSGNQPDRHICNNNPAVTSSVLSDDSRGTTVRSLSSTVDSGYLTNDPENDMYSSLSYTKSLQKSAQNLYSGKIYGSGGSHRHESLNRDQRKSASDVLNVNYSEFKINDKRNSCPHTVTNSTYNKSDINGYSTDGTLSAEYQYPKNTVSRRHSSVHLDNDSTQKPQNGQSDVFEQQDKLSIEGRVSYRNNTKNESMTDFMNISPIKGPNSTNGMSQYYRSPGYSNKSSSPIKSPLSPPGYPRQQQAPGQQNTNNIYQVPNNKRSTPTRKGYSPLSVPQNNSQSNVPQTQVKPTSHMTHHMSGHMTQTQVKPNSYVNTTVPVIKSPLSPIENGIANFTNKSNVPQQNRVNNQHHFKSNQNRNMSKTRDYYSEKRDNCDMNKGSNPQTLDMNKGSNPQTLDMNKGSNPQALPHYNGYDQPNSSWNNLASPRTMVSRENTNYAKVTSEKTVNRRSFDPSFFNKNAPIRTSSVDSMPSSANNSSTEIPPPSEFSDKPPGSVVTSSPTAVHAYREQSPNDRDTTPVNSHSDMHQAPHVLTSNLVGNTFQRNSDFVEKRNQKQYNSGTGNSHFEPVMSPIQQPVLHSVPRISFVDQPSEPLVAPAGKHSENHSNNVSHRETRSARYNTLPGNFKYGDIDVMSNTMDSENNNTAFTEGQILNNSQHSTTPAKGDNSHASLYQILQCYTLHSVKLSITDRLVLLNNLRLEECTVALPSTGQSSKADNSVQSTPQGKYAQLGGPGSAFKPVKSNLATLVPYNMVMVGDVSPQINASCEVGEFQTGDVIVEVGLGTRTFHNKYTFHWELKLYNTNCHSLCPKFGHLAFFMG